MNPNYYIRKVNPDGTGDVVVPIMSMPAEMPSNDERIGDGGTWDTWLNHLTSLPSVGIATKELTEANRIGFVKECEVGYQVWCREVGVDDGRYYTVSKRFYNSPLNEGSRRLVLSLPKNAEEETVTLTRKQVSEIFSDENLAVKLPYFNTDAQNDACVKGAEFVINQINKLFKKH